MNSVHDMGGMMGFGPVVPEPESVRFHADWEKRALAITLAIGALGKWNIDASRFSRESLPPAQYLSSGYYQIWLAALQNMLVRHDLISAAELAGDAPVAAGDDLAIDPAAIRAAFQRGTNYARPAQSPARFAPGQRVRARVMNPADHTRLPRYVRGRVGVIDRVHGVFIFPDSHAQGQGEDPQWLYTVAFDGAELWGPEAEPGTSVSVDAWETYLEPA